MHETPFYATVEAQPHLNLILEPSRALHELHASPREGALQMHVPRTLRAAPAAALTAGGQAARLSSGG
jgi:hypothetical protein